jgi:hypothetical protein
MKHSSNLKNIFTWINIWRLIAITRQLTWVLKAVALGYVWMQGIAVGHIESLEYARNLVRKSFPPSIYLPEEPKEWDRVYRRLLGVIK